MNKHQNHTSYHLVFVCLMDSTAEIIRRSNMMRNCCWQDNKKNEIMHNSPTQNIHFSIFLYLHMVEIIINSILVEWPNVYSLHNPLLSPKKFLFLLKQRIMRNKLIVKVFVLGKEKEKRGSQVRRLHRENKI